MKETALGLLIPEDVDAADGPAQIGGNATKADALFQAGGVAKRIFVAGENGRTSSSFGSFTTPMLLTLPKVLATQILEVVCFGWAKVTGTGSLRLTVPGNNSVVSSALPRETNTWFSVRGSNVGAALFLDTAANATPVTPLDKPHGFPGSPGTADVMRYINKEDRTNFTVELQGSAATGTITLTQAFLAVRVWG